MASVSYTHLFCSAGSDIALGGGIDQRGIGVETDQAAGLEQRPTTQVAAGTDVGQVACLVVADQASQVATGLQADIAMGAGVVDGRVQVPADQPAQCFRCLLYTSTSPMCRAPGSSTGWTRTRPA